MKLFTLLIFLISTSPSFAGGFQSISIDGYTDLKLENLKVSIEERIDEGIQKVEFSSSMYNPIDLALLLTNTVDEVEKYEVHFEGEPITDLTPLGSFRRETDYTCSIYIKKEKKQVIMMNCFEFGGYNPQDIRKQVFSFEELNITKETDVKVAEFLNNIKIKDIDRYAKYNYKTQSKLPIRPENNSSEK